MRGSVARVGVCGLPGAAPGRDGNRWTLHSVSKSPHFISNLFVPLVECDKPWIATRLRGGLTVADQLLEQPVSHWRVLGEATMGGEKAILAEIAQNDTFTVPLKGHAGGLSMTQGYLAWFSKMHGWMPLRIEQTMRYGYGGREYRLERRPDGMAPLVYVASDFARFRDVWVPRAGSQTLYVPKEFSPAKSEKFDPDELVDKLVAAGAARFPGERKIGYRREWKILDVGPIDPSLNVWFEPQAGAEVLNTETHHRYIVGNAVASARFAARESHRSAGGACGPRVSEGSHLAQRRAADLAGATRQGGDSRFLGDQLRRVSQRFATAAAAFMRSGGKTGWPSLECMLPVTTSRRSKKRSARCISIIRCASTRRSSSRQANPRTSFIRANSRLNSASVRFRILSSSIGTAWWRPRSRIGFKTR